MTEERNYDYEISGDSVGHMLPACVYGLVGIAGIVYTMNRVHCVPVIEKSAIRSLSIVLFIGTFTGLSMEFINGGKDLSFGLAHKAFYTPFLATSIVGILESKDLLPEASHRKMAAFANLVHYSMMYDHAQMQGGSQKPAHEYLAYLDLSCAVAFAWSAYDKNNVEAVLMSFVCTLMASFWLITISWLFYPFLTKDQARNHQPATHVIAPLFIIECSALITACYLVAAYKIGKDKKKGISLKNCTIDEEENPIM